jgi:hypothetical protein
VNEFDGDFSVYRGVDSEMSNSSLPFSPITQQQHSFVPDHDQLPYSVVPDHSNVIFVCARYTLDELTYNHLYYLFPALKSKLEPMSTGLIDYRVNANSEKFFAFNYDEITP